MNIFKKIFRLIKPNICKHEFLGKDLKMTRIPLLKEPDKNDYIGWEEYNKKIYSHVSFTKRVKWPCRKCSKVFYAHCGLDILGTYGKCIGGWGITSYNK